MELAVTIDEKIWLRTGFDLSIQEKIQQLVNEETEKCRQTFADFAAINSVTIEIKPSRANSFLGQMMIKPAVGKSMLSGVMKLSAGVIRAGDEKELRGVIMHEILHLLPGGKGHRGVWRQRAEILNDKYGYCIKRCGKSHEWIGNREQNKYLLTCQNCGHKYYYKRKSRNVRCCKRARCGRCGGELTLTIL